MSTFSELKSNVSKTLGLDETASGTEDVLLGRRLNQAVRDFLLRTKSNTNKGTISISSTISDATLGTSVLAVTELYVTDSDSDIWTPERVPLAEIIRLRRATGTGTSRYYALSGNDLFSFYPDLVSGDTVTVYYVPRPTEMSAGANDPSTETYGGVPAEYHDALELYALWWMADYDDDSSSRMGLNYQAQYLARVRECRRAIWNKGGRRLGKAIVGRRRYVSPDPSQDI